MDSLTFFAVVLAVALSSVAAYEYEFEHQIIHASGVTTPKSSGLKVSWDGSSNKAAVESEINLKSLDFSGVTGTPNEWFYTVSTATTTYSLPFCTLLPNSSLSPKLRLSINLSPGFSGELSSFNLRVTNKLIDTSPSPLCSSPFVEKIKKGLKEETATTTILLLPETSDVIPVSLKTRPPPGMIPLKRNKDVASEISFDTKGKAGKEGEEKAGGQSILGKYWWVILPLAVMTLTAPASEEGGAQAKAK